MMVKRVTRQTKHDIASNGSALILTVVLTSLLAIIGVLFVMLSRMDRLGANAALQSQEMEMAVRSVLDRINEQLVKDMPENNSNAEYYDYPGINDPWLASLEPNEDAGGVTYWPQITQLVANSSNYRHVVIDTDNAFINDYPTDINVGQLADADGDGIADSRWFAVPALQTNRGDPVYAAVRIIDHGAMLNVNTAYDFDSVRFDADARQMQVGLTYLATRGQNGKPKQILDRLNDFRADGKSDVYEYYPAVVSNFGLTPGGYRPFDIADELKLRYRFVLNDQSRIVTRIGGLWSNAYWGGHQVPIDSGPAFKDWKQWLSYDGVLNHKDPNQPNVDPNHEDYDFRHISTTYNADRLIDAHGNLQANINQDSAETIFDRMIEATSPDDANRVRLAQLAVNLFDFLHPTGSEPTSLNPQTGDPNVYGFKPQPFISEIVCMVDPNGGAVDSANNYFAVELFNPFGYSIDTNGLSLQLNYTTDVNQVIPLDGLGEFGPYERKVIANRQYQAKIEVNDVNAVDPLLVLATFNGVAQPTDWCTVFLRRMLDNGTNLVLDKQPVFAGWLLTGPAANAGNLTSLYRYDGMLGVSPETKTSPQYSVAYVPQSFDPNLCGSSVNTQSLGAANSTRAYPMNRNLPRRDNYTNSVAGPPLALKTVAELARMPIIGPRPSLVERTMGETLSDPNSLESDIYLDLVNKHYRLRSLFQGVTVYNAPEQHRVKGRININTAPRFVLQRLPWLDVKLRKEDGAVLDTNQVAGEIVENRIVNGLERPYTSIGDLLSLDGFLLLGRDGTNNNQDTDANVADKLSAFYQPDMTPDRKTDDFEEELELFSLVSNQVTVRSDVFSAYILVRLGNGNNAPQRRMLAILDRSGVTGPSDAVKIVALQRVPSAR